MHIYSHFVHHRLRSSEILNGIFMDVYCGANARRKFKAATQQQPNKILNERHVFFKLAEPLFSPPRITVMVHFDDYFDK